MHQFSQRCGRVLIRTLLINKAPCLLAGGNITFSRPIYDSSAKSLFTPALAQRWGQGFDARPRMSMKWGEASREC
ncbi:MAG: hypothetical protein IJT32_00090, partial [Lachnospiraceae bacterium]|nr:hypothetical protein [Lachnospiraceae bacterium]